MHVRLLEAFPPHQKRDWQERLEEDFRETGKIPGLRSKTYEGIDVEALYDVSDSEAMTDVHRKIREGEKGLTSGNGVNAWEIRQDITVRDIHAANARALYMVEKGTDAIGFDLGGKTDLDQKDLEALLENLDLTMVPLHWNGEGDYHTLLKQFQKLAVETGQSPASFRGSIGMDPLGRLTLTGSYRHTFEKDMNGVGNLLSAYEDVFPQMRMVEVSAHHIANAGGSAVQELAYGLSQAAEYFSYLTDRGIPVERIARHFQLNLSTGNHYFFEIAKLRAARILFTAFLRAYGMDNADTRSLCIQSITSNWNKTLYGSHVNMLRLTTESMAAVLGGCDSLLVKPFDDCYREAGGFSERLARNLQIILREESYFDKVSDPGAGSWYIESITRSLCDKAWEMFLETEDRGGYVAIFIAGHIQKSVREKAKQRREKAAFGKDILLGTNAYPDADETMSGVLDPGKGFVMGPVAENLVAEPLHYGRASVAFEKIRLAVEKHPGGRPRAFMLTFGDLHMRLARSQFSCNFFASAGYEVIDNLGFEDLKEGVEEALRSESDIIVACSSDEEYAVAIPKIHELLNGRALLVVTGQPPSMEALKETGICDFIHRNADMIETFETLNAKLGIAPYT